MEFTINQVWCNTHHCCFRFLSLLSISACFWHFTWCSRWCRSFVRATLWHLVICCQVFFRVLYFEFSLVKDQKCSIHSNRNGTGSLKRGVVLERRRFLPFITATVLIASKKLYFTSTSHMALYPVFAHWSLLNSGGHHSPMNFELHSHCTIIQPVGRHTLGNPRVSSTGAKLSTADRARESSTCPQNTSEKLSQ